MGTNIIPGSTDVTVMFALPVNLTVADLRLRYVRDGAAASTEQAAVELAAADSAHTDNRAYESADGVYRVDWPDAAFAAGVNGVTLAVRLDGQEQPLAIERVVLAFSNPSTTVTLADGAHGGAAATITLATPINANCTKLGGTTVTGRDIGASVLLSPGTGAGQISLTTGAVTVGTNNDKTGYTASTVSDKTGYALAADGLNAAAVKDDAVTKIQAGLATPTNITAGTITTATNLTNAPTAGDLTAAMKTSVNAEADAAIETYRLHELMYTALASPPATGSLVGDLTADDAGTQQFTANALEQAPSGGASAGDIADAVLDEALSEHAIEDTLGNVLNDLTEENAGTYRFTSGALGQAPTGGGTSAEIADAVLDELVSDHQGAGSLGKEVHLLKAATVNRRLHTLGGDNAGRDEVYDDDGATLLRTMVPVQRISLAGANWTDATKRITKTGAFTNYVWKSGDLLNLTAGTGVITGQYTISSRIDDDTIALAIDINGASGDIGDSSITGSISTGRILRTVS